MAFSDNFNRADNAVLGNGWDESEAPGSYQILSNKCRATGSPGFESGQLKRPAGEAFEDGTVEVDFQFVTDTSALPFIWGRTQTGSDNTGYTMYIAGGNIHLAKSIFGSLTDLDSLAGLTLTVGTNYNYKLQMTGTLIEGFLKNLDTNTILASMSATNVDITGTGKQGISIHTGGILDYDNFIATIAGGGGGQSVVPHFTTAIHRIMG